MKCKHRLLTLLVFLISTIEGMAETGHLYMSDKLSSGLITCVCQDRYGYIWIGTEYGLNKFDGYRYTTYFHSRTDSTTISDNEVSSLFVDREGRLWVGCSRGLVRYDYSTNSFHRFTFPDNRMPRINSLQQAVDGRLLIGTAGYGLYSLVEGTPIHYESNFNRRHGDHFYSRMHIDCKGNLWRSSHTTTFTRFVLKNGQPETLRDYTSACGQPMQYVENGEQLLIVCMHGILSYDYRTGEITNADYDLSLLDHNVSFEDAIIDGSGDIYIATSGSGLMKIARNSRELTSVASGNGHIDLKTTNVVDVMEDKDRNLWVACYAKGLMVLPRQESPFQTWSLSEQRYVTGGGVSSIATGNGGSVWCTVQNSGVYQFDSNGHVIAHPQSPAGTRLIFHSRKGSYWLTTENMLYRYNPETGQAVAELTLNGRGLNCMAEDQEGRLYICTFGLGLYVYDPATRQGKLLSMQQTERKDGYLWNDWIKGLMFDSHGLLWICTTDGLSMMQPEGYVFNAKGWNVLLEGKQCYTTCETTDGNILIGTENGLYCYDRKRNTVAEVPDTEPLHDKMICAMVRDQQGDIWISTTMGIWQYKLKGGRLIGHTAGMGLTTNEYVLGAMIHHTDDRISFGTADGLVTFRPHAVTVSKLHLGKTFLTRFTADGKTLNCMTDRFELPYADNSFTMEFSLLDYRNTDNIVFLYRVNGGNTWQQTTEGNNQLAFNQLQPGIYTIEVKAAAGSVVSDQVTTLMVTVLKPWYKSTWAYMAYLLVVAGFIGLLLFNWERQRKRDLEETKMQFLINATHDIRSPLTLIMGPLEKLKKRLAGSDNMEDLDTIDKNAQRLLLLVNQILDERKIDKQQMRLACQETDLVAFTNGIYKLFEYKANEMSIRYSFEHPEGVVKVWIDRIQFDKVISNLLSNAFKYTRDEVKIRISTTAKTAVIEVIDNGNGFESDKTERFFQRFYQGKNSKDIHVDGTGIGLNLCLALTEMHGGRVTAVNRKGDTTGAILTVTLPLGKDHLKPEYIEEKQPTDSEQQSRQQSYRNIKVLIVDDDEEIAKYIRQELGEWYKFTYAPNGREALKLLLTRSFDLVVSDVMMPEMDGITLLRSIKSNSNISDIPVILLTSKSDVQYRLEGLKRGADAFIAKPFAMQELKITIDKLVDNVRRLRGKYTGALAQADKVEQVKVKGNNDVLMEKIMRCVNENLSDPDFGMEVLTREVGISRAQLHRKMKELTGISTSEFIRNLRLEQAARLIREKKVNITQVAYAVGFNNQAHFSTVFKKHFGMSPTEFAEN